MNNTTFDQFTNLYSLSKTLRFELKPVGRTQQMIKEAKVFEKDETIQKKYEATKPYFDRLHREFVKESLKDICLSGLSDEYFQMFKKWKIDKKTYEKEFQKKEGELRKEIAKYFNNQGKLWAEQYTGLKNKNIEILFEEAVFERILKARYGEEKQTKMIDESTGEFISIFDSWKGFVGYFGKFFETRKNFYKDDGTSTALATRIIDQNLKRFCDNIITLEGIKEKIDFSEVEKNFGKSLSEVFSISFYNNCLLQDGINFYNKILGGETLSNGEKKKGLNECVNLHKQKTGEKLPFFKTLDKQILSEKESFIIDEITKETLLENLQKFFQTAETKTKILKTLFVDFIKNQEIYDLYQIYIDKKVFSPHSSKYIDQGSVENFQQSLEKILKKEKQTLSGDFFALKYIKEALEQSSSEKFWKEKYYINDNNNILKGFLSLTTKANIWDQFLAIFNFEFSSLFERETIKQETGVRSKIGYDIFKKNFENILHNFNPDRILQEDKVVIKNFSDCVLTIYQMAKYFAVEKKRAWNTDYELDVFYTDPENGYLKFYDNAYEEIVQLYNKIRNYLTKKPYSEEKWKLNFECSYLLGGWSSEFETYGSLLFEKNGKYYLGVINGKALSKEKRQTLTQSITNENRCRKMVYDFQKPDNKNVPRLFIRSKGKNFAPAVEELNLPIKTVLDIYDQGLFKTENKNHPSFKESLIKMIDYFKLGFSRHNSYKHFSFKWKESSKYKNIADFYQDTIRSCYQLKWEDLNFDEVRKLSDSQEMYLFQVYNKDFSNKSKGSKNLHSLYFQTLFLNENLQNKEGVVFKLSGGGEMFFRPKTAKEKLGERYDSKGKSVIKTKRYAEDKIFLHFPIELNYARGREGNFNAQVNTFLANNPNINIIGVDRGEKHLAYFSVITQKGEILDSGSLNFVGNDGEGKSIDYAQKLLDKAKDREQSRKDWQTVEGIKELKKGYISQVVRKLADLAIKHNAIIVFEDLNMRFKQIRGGIEKSVYQQLEKALIEKLNFLVQKGEVDSEKAGHLLKAYQLTDQFETFQKMGKQTGILFYTQASYTSKIDPITGWRPHLYLKYSSAEKAKSDILKFSKIAFTNQRFEFTYDIKNFQPNNKEYPRNTIWTVCSSVERFCWNKHLNNNKGGYDDYENLTQSFENLFSTVNIDISGDILGQIKTLDPKGNEKFFKDFIFFFNLICQIRNTDERAIDSDKQDFILSPVEPFFDSRKDNGKNLPKNGDDNGAYNIARKGIIILNKISKYSKQNGNCEKIKWGDLFISKIDWDNFITK